MRLQGWGPLLLLQEDDRCAWNTIRSSWRKQIHQRFTCDAVETILQLRSISEQLKQSQFVPQDPKKSVYFPPFQDGKLQAWFWYEGQIHRGCCCLQNCVSVIYGCVWGSEMNWPQTPRLRLNQQQIRVQNIGHLRCTWQNVKKTYILYGSVCVIGPSMIIPM